MWSSQDVVLKLFLVCLIAILGSQRAGSGAAQSKAEPERTAQGMTTVVLSPRYTNIAPAETCTLSVIVESDSDSLGCIECWVSFDTSLVKILLAEEGRLFKQAPYASIFFWQIIAPDTHSVEGCLLGYRTYTLTPGEITRYVFEAKENGVCPVRITRLNLSDIDRVWYQPVVDPNAWIVIGPATGIDPVLPVEGRLDCYPNPFNPSTTIIFSPSSAMTGSLPTDVSIAIYSIDGRLVRRVFDGKISAGAKRVVWDGLNQEGNEVTSGVYFVVATTKWEKHTTKLVLIR